MASNKEDRFRSAGELLHAINILEQAETTQQTVHTEIPRRLTARVPVMFLVSATLLFFFSVLFDGQSSSSSITFPEIPGLPTSSKSNLDPSDSTRLTTQNPDPNDRTPNPDPMTAKQSPSDRSQSPLLEAAFDAENSAATRTIEVTQSGRPNLRELPEANQAFPGFSISSLLESSINLKPEKDSSTTPGTANTMSEMFKTGTNQPPSEKPIQPAKEDSTGFTPTTPIQPALKEDGARLGKPTSVPQANRSSGAAVQSDNPTKGMIGPIDSFSNITTIQVRPFVDRLDPQRESLENLTGNDTFTRPNTLVAKSLQQAIDALKFNANVHTIELCFDGVINVAAMTIPVGSLRSIQAGSGFNPTLRFLADEKSNLAAMLAVDSGVIEISSVDFIFDTSNLFTRSEPLALIGIASIQRAVFSNCSFTHIGNSDTSLPVSWFQLNTVPISITPRQLQGLLTIENCSIRGIADVMNIRYFGPLMLQVKNSWLLTAGVAFRIGGQNPDSTNSLIEVSLEKTILLARSGLADLKSQPAQRHGDFRLRARQCLLSQLGMDGALITHSGRIDLDNYSQLLFFEGESNIFSAPSIWRISSEDRRNETDHSFRRAELQEWFRQTDAIDLSTFKTPGLSMPGTVLSPAEMASASWQDSNSSLRFDGYGVKQAVGPDYSSLRSFPNATPLQ